MARRWWIARLGVIVLAGAMLLTAVGVGVAPRVWRIANAHSETPVDLPDFLPLSQRSYVYDAAGNEIAVYELQNSQPITLDDIPTHVVDAFVAVEDNEFYVHHGVNVRSLIRAVLSNFASDAPVQGASTITMQVVKNDFMAGFDRDGRYKITQIAYAVRLEKELSKDEIMERYLNTVYFGNNSYGIAAAAETYFGKLPADLTFIESAFLAGLVRAPSSYDPINRPERSRARFIQVVDRLVEDELLTEAEASEVLDTFVIPERRQQIPTRQIDRTYFSEAVRQYLLNDSDILGDTYEERYTALYRGGLRIHTTLNPTMQTLAEDARDVLPDTVEGFDAAITTVDNATGAIRAMVGGRGFIPNQREVNLALAPSQTGSSIKIFILAAALQAGAIDADILDGTRPCTLPNTADPNEPEFTITGGVSGGVASLREHTYRSINCAFARLSQIVGLHRVVDTVYRMAASDYLRPGLPAEVREPIQPFASFATGANEMSTLDMAAGMQSIANSGVHVEPYYVERIEDADGRRLYTHTPRTSRVLDAAVADAAIDIMKDTLVIGTARRSLAGFAEQRPAAGKTGTQQDNTTAWFVGATRQFSTAVMVRDPDRYTAMVNIPEFVEAGVPRVQGGTFPAQIWGAYMEPAHAGLDPLDWNAPPAAVRSPVRLYLPGNECAGVIVGFEQPEIPTRIDPVTGEEVPISVVIDDELLQPQPIYEQVTTGTTVPVEVTDPNAGLPSVPLDAYVGPCEQFIDGVVPPQ
ncbi:MAG: transglycosylase domain-containing protein [Ilumatobacteraceae bacterium]